MEVQGKIIVLNDTESIGTKEFKKRLVVVQTDEQYPQTIPVEFTKDKTSLLNNFSIGDFVKIGINLRGTEWNGRYFANINGWKIDKADSSLTAQQQMPDRQPVYGSASISINPNTGEVQDDDLLPF
jgi:hypothetical protein